MAEKKYSKKDQDKRREDTLQNLNAKGVIQYGTFTSVHPGGEGEALKFMEKNQSAVRDQSQAELSKGKDQSKQRMKDVQEAAERNRDARNR